jgi:hypothetical protein
LPATRGRKEEGGYGEGWRKRGETKEKEKRGRFF